MSLKKVILLSLTLLVVGTTLVNAQTKCTKMKGNRMNELLDGAIYDSGKPTKIESSDNAYEVKYQINIFKGVTYKLIFDVSDMPEGVIIKLYDLGSKKGAEKKEQIFSSKEAKKTENNTYEIALEYPQRKMMISYSVNEGVDPGCTHFLLGYYMKALLMR